MENRRPCPSCFVSLSENQKVCPNCGKPNPYYDPDHSAASPSGAGNTYLHHAKATAGKCEYCDSTLYSDEKICPYCGAANPNFVVHGTEETSSAGGTRFHGTTNASTGKCPYCGATVRSNEKNCPECGSENPHYVEDTVRVILHPKTVEELKEYCAERDMPLLRMRFFIGENTPEPKAFGIYKDGTGNTIVYKNKADGSRAVRYNGPDEAYAVDQILTKLKEECRSRGIDPDHSLNGQAARNAAGSNGGYTPYAAKNRSASGRQKNTSGRKWLWTVLIIIGVLFLLTRLWGGCLACVNYFASDSFYSGSSSYSSGSSSYSSGSSSDSGWSSSWDSGSDSGWSSWDSGSDSGSWDSWDSGGSDWDSDW